MTTRKTLALNPEAATAEAPALKKKGLSSLVIASVAKQSRATRDTLWIAASPAAPRNDEGAISLEGSVG